MSELITCSILLIILVFFAAGAYLGTKLSAKIHIYKRRKPLGSWRLVLYTAAAILIVLVVTLLVGIQIGYYLIGSNGVMLGLSGVLSMEFGFFIALSE